MPPAARLVLPGVALCLGACGALEPFSDYITPRERATVPVSRLGTPTTAAVCFGGDEKRQAAALQAAADTHCDRLGLKARYTQTQHFRCTFLQPHVAYFQCLTPAQMERALQAEKAGGAAAPAPLGPVDRPLEGVGAWPAGTLPLLRGLDQPDPASGT